jgi:glycosyltransferase domain-containing protein
VENKLFELVESTAPNLLLPNLQKLTVIVPIFSRQELIFRQIAHWHGTGSKLIIIDGSETKLDSNSVKFISSFSNVNYLYIKKAFCTRLNIVTKFINTPYTVLSPDDYFHSPSGSEAIINYLENNQSVCACTGQSIHSIFDKNSLNIRFTSFKNRLNNYQVVEENSYKRLENAFSKYNGATNFSIMRSEIWQSSWGNLDPKYSSTNIYEIEQAFSVYISGKVSSLNVFGFLTTNEFPAINNDEDNRTLLFEHWWTSDEFEREKKNFVNKISSKLSSQEDISPESASVLIQNIINEFVKNKSNFSIMYENYKIGSYLAKTIELAKSVLPITTYNMLRDNFIVLSGNKKFLPLEKFVKYNTYPVLNNSYINEMKRIKDLIIRFHREL